MNLIVRTSDNTAFAKEIVFAKSRIVGTSKTLPDESRFVRQLLMDAAHSRDQLPYTHEFAELKEREIDFIMTMGLHRVPIEVKYRRSRPGGDDLKGIHSFCGQAKYNAPFGLVITQDFSGRLDEYTIAIPAYTFLALR